MAAASLFGKTKTPPPGWQWGSLKSYSNESEPDCRAAQQQRVVQQQIQIQVTIHNRTLTTTGRRVNFNFCPTPIRDSPLPLGSVAGGRPCSSSAILRRISNSVEPLDFTLCQNITPLSLLAT
jgi:hypothetical protein